MDERIEALAAYLDVDPETISEGYENHSYETEDGEEYFVVTEDEARELAEEDIRNFLDDQGIEGFTKEFQQYIIDNGLLDSEWFEAAMRESYEFYFDDILGESSSSDFDNRAIEELYDNDILTDEDFEVDEDGNPDYSRLKDGVSPEDYKDEFVDKLCEGWNDPIQWYIDNFGDGDLVDVVKSNNLLDEDAVIDTAIEWDGVAHFIARYDGDEIELDNGFFAYRIN